ncbi:hypothetical protein [Novosphingobium acidiphilum]|uniref:hypothetical protein n=1 Tax=Novosphingobium acidiphilum TaxID=505248 RepID=UPI00040B6372|nr:hypothetical protein [Novosphingobium acidiphilum]
MLLPPELLEGRIGMIGTTGLGLLPKMPEISPEMDDRIEPALLLLPDPLHDEAGLDGWAGLGPLHDNVGVEGLLLPPKMLHDEAGLGGWAWLALLLPELPHDTLGLDGLDDLAGAGLLEPNKLHAMAGLVVMMLAVTTAMVAMRFMSDPLLNSPFAG